MIGAPLLQLNTFALVLFGGAFVSVTLLVAGLFLSRVSVGSSRRHGQMCAAWAAAAVLLSGGYFAIASEAGLGLLKIVLGGNWGAAIWIALALVGVVVFVVPIFLVIAVVHLVAAIRRRRRSPSGTEGIDPK